MEKDLSRFRGYSQLLVSCQTMSDLSIFVLNDAGTAVTCGFLCHFVSYWIIAKPYPLISIERLLLLSSAEKTTCSGRTLERHPQTQI